MQQFNVLVGSEVIDTVYYNKQSADTVKAELIKRGEYPADINVQRVYFTRDEYLSYSVLNGEYSKERAFAAHCRYYSQFDCAAIRSAIPFKLNTLLESTDPYFNDLPLQRWDDAVRNIPVFVWKHVTASCCSKPDGTYRWSLSDGVCLLKQSARNLVNEQLRSSPSAV